MPSFSISNNSAPSFSAISKVSEKPAKPLVWIVGTDAETRLLYKVFLESWNFKTIEAVCFEELLSIVEYFQPALILMDGSLSFEENLDEIRRIRKCNFLHKIPLVLTSGHSQAKTREQALQSGADDYLVKPLNFGELQNNLQKVIEKSGASVN